MSDESSYGRLLRMVERFPILTASDESALFARYQQGDTSAGNKIVSAHLRVALKVARQVKSQTFFDDAYSEACIGLLLALDRFDPNKDCRFATYAETVVKNHVRACTTQAESILHYPDGRRTRILNRILKNGGNFEDLPSGLLDEAKKKGITPMEVEDRRFSNMSMVNSLDDSLRPGHPTLSETLPSLQPGQDEIMSSEQEIAHLRAAIDKVLPDLDERRRMVLANKISPDGKSEYALASNMGISHARVRALGSEVLGMLRSELSPRQPSLATS